MSDPEASPLSQEINVVTFPIGVRSDPPKFGLSVPSIISRVFANRLQGEFTLAINTIDSYVPEREKYVEPYLQTLDKLGVRPDSLWWDREQVEGLHEAVDKLIQKGHLAPQLREIEVCECGKVERLKGTYVQPGARLYDLQSDGSTVCKNCSGPCASVQEEVLVLTMPNEIETPVVHPPLMRREAAELASRIRGMEFLASRSRRDTGISIEVKGKTHNLDVDFFWLNYLDTFSDATRLAVATNHVTWHMILSHALLQLVDLEMAQKTQIMLAPYIYNRNNYNPHEHAQQIIGSHTKKLGLYVLMNLAWSKQSSSWDPIKLRLLDRADDEALGTVWDAVTGHDDSTASELTSGAIEQVVHSIRNDEIIKLIKGKRTIK